jgi:hypothetical protein
MGVGWLISLELCAYFRRRGVIAFGSTPHQRGVTITLTKHCGREAIVLLWCWGILTSIPRRSGGAKFFQLFEAVKILEFFFFLAPKARTLFPTR